MTVGTRIKLLRESHGISQTDLALKIGESKQNLYKYETGKITNIPSDKIELIAAELGCSPAYLMGWELEMNPMTDEELDARARRIIEYYKRLSPEMQDSIESLLINSQPKS